tara:strand:+ start:9177 stop:10019 length:843 start_codon:yes stop_codon:yes gene_type:complete
MKVILGDNQFFGVNHFNLKKGEKTKLKFDSVKKIEVFINDSLNIGLDGFMINSNNTGYELISQTDFKKNKEIHYSIPYPHKYANMVNEKGMLSMLNYIIKNTYFIKNILIGIKLIFTRNVKYLIPLVLDVEVPSNLKKGSYIYMQNVVTDLLVGMGKGDLIIDFINTVTKLGYKPGLITLNPVKLNEILTVNDKILKVKELIVCFNINKQGFNTFPSKKAVENFINSKPRYKTMGMSVFASGAAGISESIKYLKKLKLDYVVFGTSKLKNVKSNFELLKK